ncbi:MAG: hypothetical protein WC343_13160, partial [Bacilli bacterium]
VKEGSIGFGAYNFDSGVRWNVDGWIGGTNCPTIIVLKYPKKVNYLAIYTACPQWGDITGCDDLEWLCGPIVTGDITNMINMYYLSANYAIVNAITGSVTGHTKLGLISLENNNNLSGVLSSSSLYYLYIKGNNTININVTNHTNLKWLQPHGGAIATGNIEGLTLLETLNEGVGTTITGSIAGLTNLRYCYMAYSSGVTYPNVTNLKGLCLLVISFNYVISSENVNQLLADFWANKDEAKPITNRVIHLSGKAGSGAPTGQGITDKTALQAYRSPNNDGQYSVWTVTTR